MVGTDKFHSLSLVTFNHIYREASTFKLVKDSLDITILFPALTQIMSYRYTLTVVSGAFLSPNNFKVEQSQGADEGWDFLYLGPFPPASIRYLNPGKTTQHYLQDFPLSPGLWE